VVALVVALATNLATAKRLEALEGVGYKTLVLLQELVAEFKAIREIANHVE
jgi:hypothetical protein